LLDEPIGVVWRSTEVGDFGGRAGYGKAPNSCAVTAVVVAAAVGVVIGGTLAVVFVAAAFTPFAIFAAGAVAGAALGGLVGALMSLACPKT
jgi:hypothetical protein